MKESIIKLEGIGKKFGGNYVLKDISLEIGKGEIHSIIGENGAGKSTLMKIIGGVYIANEGKMYKDGKEVLIHNPLEAYAHGIGIVHQELSVAPNLSVAENIFAGRQPINKLGFVKFAQMYEDTAVMLNDIGIQLDPKTKLGTLSVAMQQVVEIAKVVSHDIDVLILDEPTSSLSDNEIEHLFKLVKKMQVEKNMTIVFISHKLNEVIQISDKVTVLRNGNLAGALEGEDITQPNMIRLMVGEDVDSRSFLPPETKEGEEIFSIENLCNGRKFKNVSLKARKNRIVGMFGLIGAGRTETILSAIGADKIDSGRILLDGKEVRFKSPEDAIAHGVTYLTENRRDFGLFLSKGIPDNIISSVIKNYTTKINNIDYSKIDKVADKYIKELSIVPGDKAKSAGTFSGGNQQKILFSKVLETHPRVLIVDEPTRGVDVGVKMTIHKMLRELADSGMALIVISSELPEILKLSDEIVVMHEGQYKGTVVNDGISEHDIMTMAYSSSESEAAV